MVSQFPVRLWPDFYFCTHNKDGLPYDQTLVHLHSPLINSEKKHIPFTPYELQRFIPVFSRYLHFYCQRSVTPTITETSIKFRTTNTLLEQYRIGRIFPGNLLVGITCNQHVNVDFNYVNLILDWLNWNPNESCSDLPTNYLKIYKLHLVLTKYYVYSRHRLIHSGQQCLNFFLNQVSRFDAFLQDYPEIRINLIGFDLLVAVEVYNQLQIRKSAYQHQLELLPVDLAGVVLSYLE